MDDRARQDRPGADPLGGTLGRRGVAARPPVDGSYWAGRSCGRFTIRLAAGRRPRQRRRPWAASWWPWARSARATINTPRCVEAAVIASASRSPVMLSTPVAGEAGHRVVCLREQSTDDVFSNAPASTDATIFMYFLPVGLRLRRSLRCARVASVAVSIARRAAAAAAQWSASRHGSRRCRNNVD